MKVALIGINARSIHASPALYSLYQTAQTQGVKAQLVLLEYALHTPTQHLMAQIYNQRPDILAFSLYIWNVPQISALIKDIKQLLPEAKIIVGGPEASARAGYYLQQLEADAICIGEGEEAFAQLLQEYQPVSQELPAIPGFLLRGKEAQYQPRPAPDLAALPFLYQGELANYLSASHKLVYYESSRGCPYGCTFCASAHQPLRERPLELVLAELPQLANIGGQVKFIDRTFNANRKRAIAISEAMLALQRPGLSWHMEINPFALDDELVQLWQQAPTDYFHLEIGVQTLYPPALQAIDRHGNWDSCEPLVKQLIAAPGCHVHLDLIAGLPGDTPAGFAASFDRLHALQADYLQFGFLKVLPGSLLAQQAGEQGLLYSSQPPYQVLATPTMSPQYLFDLHRAERAFNALYNKRDQFKPQLVQLAKNYGSALEMYLQAAQLMPPRGLNPAEAAQIIQQLAQ